MDLNYGSNYQDKTLIPLAATEYIYSNSGWIYNMLNQQFEMQTSKYKNHLEAIVC